MAPAGGDGRHRTFAAQLLKKEVGQGALRTEENSEDMCRGAGSRGVGIAGLLILPPA